MNLKLIRLSIAALLVIDLGLVLLLATSANGQTNMSNASGANVSSYWNGHRRGGCDIWASSCVPPVPQVPQVKLIPVPYPVQDQPVYQQYQVPVQKLIPPVSTDVPSTQKLKYPSTKAPRARG